MWPTPQDYNEAVQSPRDAFSDADLRDCAPVLNALGLPKPVSGSFATVYEMHAAGGASSRRWAVRCFLRNVPHQEDRYAVISKHLASHSASCMVPFEFLHEGVRVNGSWYPVLKMQWVDGTPLIDWVERHLDDTDALSAVQRSLKIMCEELARDGIAHGDLQHGNVFVADDLSLKLVDYDGLYVPALSAMGSIELGHRHFQHPKRSTRHFGLYLDNFSAWTIYSSLCCLEQDARIWERLGGGDECLVFRQEDYCDPEDSVAFSYLEQHESAVVRETARNLRRILALKPEEVPPLGEPIPSDAEVEDVPPLAIPGQFADSSKSPAQVLVNLRVAAAAAKAPTLIVTPDSAGGSAARLVVTASGPKTDKPAPTSAPRPVPPGKKAGRIRPIAPAPIAAQIVIGGATIAFVAFCLWSKQITHEWLQHGSPPLPAAPADWVQVPSANRTARDVLPELPNAAAVKARQQLANKQPIEAINTLYEDLQDKLGSAAQEDLELLRTAALASIPINTEEAVNAYSKWAAHAEGVTPQGIYEDFNPQIRLLLSSGRTRDAARVAQYGAALESAKEGNTGKHVTAFRQLYERLSKTAGAP